MDIYFLLGFALILLTVVLMSLHGGRKISGSGDFTGREKKQGAVMVSGAIMGALVGSQSSIGTAQVAFYFGISALWFTLGSGLGCLFMLFFYLKPLRRADQLTVTGIISARYGYKVGTISSLMSAIGTYISIIVQIIACAGLMMVIFPKLTLIPAIMISVTLMSIYVVFGGAVSIGAIGSFKTVMLYGVSVICVIALLTINGPITNLVENLKVVLIDRGVGLIRTEMGYNVITNWNDLKHTYFNIFARGLNKDLGAVISLIVGIVSTQSYTQAIMGASTRREAKKGLIICSILIPPMGVFGVLIGLYMRTKYITCGEVSELSDIGKSIEGFGVLNSAVQVFPVYIMDTCPSFFAGIGIAVLLVVIVGAGAGLCLGMTTILYNDIYKPLAGNVSGEKALGIFRIMIVGVLIFGGILAYMLQKDLLNDLGFLSMGLRGSAIFIPLTVALMFKGKVDKKMVKLIIMIGPVLVLICGVMNTPIDPLFISMGVCSALCFGSAIKKRLCR